MTTLIIAAAIIAAVATMTAIACCKAAGDADRRAEELERSTYDKE